MNYPASSLDVTKLKKGANYDFRIFAENIHGDSEPLLTEGPIKAENPFCRCPAQFDVWCLFDLWQLFSEKSLWRRCLLILMNTYLSSTLER